MNKKIKAEKAAAVISAFLYTAFLITGVNAAEIQSVNYGTDENSIFGEKGIALVNVSDEYGNPVDEAEFYLADSSGENLAVWSGNNRSTFRRIQGTAAVINDSSSVDIYGVQLPDFTGGNGYTRTTEVKTGEKSSAIVKPDGMGRFKYNNVYSAETRYIVYGDTEFTVPAGSFGVYADSGYDKRPVEMYFVIAEYADPDDEYSELVNRNEFIFNQTAGKLDIRKFAEGAYPYRTGYRVSNGRGGGGGNIHNRVYINEKSYDYAKKTINLHDAFPSYFNEDGTVDRDVFGTNMHFSFSEDIMNPLQTAGVYFMSGNLVCAPLPDKNGNVTIYVDKSDYRFTMMTDFGWKNGGGGGTSGMSGYADEKAVYKINTAVIPESSVPLRGLAEGKYTVSTGEIPEKYDPASVSFTITNQDGSGVPECGVVLEYKRFSIDTENAPGGTLKVMSDITDDMNAVPVESDVRISAVPDEGYRIKNIVFSYENGMKFNSNLLSLASEDTFEMPYMNVKLIPQFGEIVKGDIDGDDTINSADVMNMMKIILNSEKSYGSSCRSAADINDDGTVNVFDLIRIARLVTGQIQNG